MSRFFVSAWGDLPDGGVYTYDLLPDGSAQQCAFAPFFHAGYLAWNSKKTFLYATGGMDDSTDCAGAFALQEDGRLALLNRQPSCGLSCCHLCVSPDDRFVYAANYRTGNFVEFAVLPDGSLAPAGKNIVHHGKGPHPERQSSAHAHFCGFSPDGKFLLVVDLGMDAVLSYPWYPGEGIDEKSVIRNSFTPGCGPRHLVFDRSGKTGYLITELGNTVVAFRYENGYLHRTGEISTLPRNTACATKAAALRLSEDERFLAVSNRGYDCVVMLELDGKGNMRPVDAVLTGGSSPRDMNFLANGSVLAVGNEFSGNVFFFDFDPVCGRLTPNGFTLELPRPLCFVE